MGNRPLRKVVLVLVEGKSDQEALSNGISNLFDQIDPNIEVFFVRMFKDSKVCGGDLTTTSFENKLNVSKKVYPSNIEDAIYELYLDSFFKKKKLYPKDISQIIHIVDTDGAFIGKRSITVNKELESPYYENDKIVAKDKELMLERNKRKKENLDFLSSSTTIKVHQKTVPYSIYYFSCNLDHFINNDANLDFNKKIPCSSSFSDKYLGNPSEFCKYFLNDADSIHNMTYEESWEYIRQDNNSLQRHTNLNLLVEKLMKEIDK